MHSNTSHKMMDTKGVDAFIMQCSCIRTYERVYTRGLVCLTLKTREIKRLGRVRITGAETGEASSSSGSAAGVYGCLRLFPDVYVASEIEKIKRPRRQSRRNCSEKTANARESQVALAERLTDIEGCTLRKSKAPGAEIREYLSEILTRNEVPFTGEFYALLTLDIDFDGSDINRTSLGNVTG